MKTNLLCTFASPSSLNLTVDYICRSYELPDKQIFVFQNTDVPSELYLTYNVNHNIRYQTQDTILIHRKKDTNTMYTVNALNEIIKKVNNGILDKTYQIDWANYRDMLLLTVDNNLKRIYLEFTKKIKF